MRVAMHPVDLHEEDYHPAGVVARRQFLGQLAATTFAATLFPNVAHAVTEVWEEGDPLCALPHRPLDKPDGYELDLAFLESFLGLSEVLVGVTPLDRQRGTCQRRRDFRPAGRRKSRPRLAIAGRRALVRGPLPLRT